MRYLFLILFFSLPAFAQEWSGPYEYTKFPKDSFLAGNEVNGNPIYLGLVFHDSKDFIKDLKNKGVSRLLEPNTAKYKGKWIIAKINPRYRGVRYAHENEEHFSKDYIAFNPSNSEKYKWVSTKDGDRPENSVKVWGPESNRYICRANWAGGIFPGVLNTQLKSCSFSFGSRERTVFIYEVLTKIE